MKYLLSVFVVFLFAGDANISMQIQRSVSVDSLGACQGLSWQGGKIFLYGDRETGIIRQYELDKDSLHYSGRECKLTVSGQDLINHPTGLAIQGSNPVFIGNSIRLNSEGTRWKAVIYCVDWEGLQKTGTLDGNILNTIEDDACIQGTRPEYVRYKNKWYVATADYGPSSNEVRLYNPALLAKAKKTSDKGVVVKRFTCSPWVQNLCFVDGKNMLILVQNQIEGKKWRFTYLDINKSLESGKEQVIKKIDINERTDELEGFYFLENLSRGIAVSSSRTNNVNLVKIDWQSAK